MYKNKYLSLIFFSILLFVNNVFAIYKDQAGVIDWYQALVGTPKISYFQKIVGRSNLIVGTEKNVIANLNLRANTINWRQVLKPDEKLINLAPFDNYIISLSESKTSNVRIWNGQNGYLFGEYILEQGSNENIENGDILVHNNYIYALVRGKTVLKINNLTKSQEGKYQLNDNYYSKLFYNEQLNEIVIAGKNKKDQLIVTIIDNNGRIVNEKSISSVKFEISNAFFTGKNLIIKDFEGKIYSIESNKEFAKSLIYKDIKELVHVNGDLFIVEINNNKNILVKINDNSIEELKSFESVEDGIISVFTNDKDIYVSKTTISNNNSSLVEIINANTKETIKVFEIKNKFTNNGRIVKVSLDSYRKRDGTILYRIFTVTQDGSIHLYKEENIVWDREESLANIIDLKFISLPEITKNIPEAIVNSSNIFTQITSRIQYQFTSIKDQIFGKNKKEYSGIEDILKRDVYGFRQLLLFYTKKGKLICIETLTKKTVWTRFIGKDIDGFEGIKLSNIRSSAVQYPPVVAAIATFNDNDEEHTAIFSIDATTGEDFNYTNKNIPSSMKYPFKLLQTFRLSINEKQDKIRITAIIKSENEVEFYPSTQEILDTIKEEEKPIFFNLNDKIEGNTIRGYKLYINDEKKPQIDLLYKKVFPEDEIIVSYGFKEPYDNVASLGKVLGNRNVLYKYLNPNVLAVATIKPDEIYTSILTVYLIDTVKGSIIHHSYYEGGGETTIMKPKIVQYENMIICTFWNHGAPLTTEEQDKETKKLRKNIKKGSQIVVFELYENEIENQKDTNQEFTSYNYLQPYIVSKAYILDNAITSIGVTTTRNGIANREVIVSLDNNELYGIHSVFLNARRKISPLTNEDKQEGLIQYRPGIPITPKSIISYNLPVTGIEAIISNPANLESTSLVAAYGLDIFLTRRSPSNNFDILSDSFNKPILVITMAAVIIGTIYSSKKIKDNDFKKAWKIKSAKKEEKDKAK
ncbi:DUF1620-domain-containing protein [Piromyces finnis]|uniref:ER membrane protein complex subunit 1 n=1 Tax=Piromyces finnis TaxID=1754191 RepID=A0A1Y1V9B6_9FUNG|nr:DUF1620-domain-containing protein [Piromyces finnis]|eukprot:ORX49949.1 DUF1620-domain-containing protein [Piromyces finnis]